MKRKWMNSTLLAIAIAACVTIGVAAVGQGVAEVDVNTNQSVTHETLTFETGRIQLAGTLAVRVISPPNPPVQFRVVSTINGTGQFDTVLGAQAFTEIRQDANGVLLIRN